MSVEPKNIDTVLIQDMTERSHGLPTKPAPAEPEPISPVQSEEPVHQESPPDEQAENLSPPAQEDVPHRTSEAPKQEKQEKQETQDADSPIDEYGNPVAPPRVYTQEEVNRMMRERLSRGRHAEQQPNQPANEEAQPAEEGQDWERELKQFVKKTFQEEQEEIRQKQWQAEEARKQEEFQDKFTNGMAKYTDFEKVVSGKSITNNMMLAARNLDNPAAFIYGACKLHPQEIDRIARIPDAFGQAAEIGKLHERMVKESRAISKAPPPIQPPKGDMGQKQRMQPSLEQRINDYAKQKRR